MAGAKKHADKSERWREIINAQSVSRKSIPAFCAERKLNRSTFWYWKRKLRDSRIANLSGRFIGITGEIRGDRGALRIVLPNGVRIEVENGLLSEAVGQFVRSLCGVGHGES